jgi:hypothetical protein
MKRVAFYLWEVASETPPGKRIKTRHKMSETDALARDPTARPLGEPEWRDIPETEEELREVMAATGPGTKTQRPG